MTCKGTDRIQIDESSKPNRHRRARGRSDPWSAGQLAGGSAVPRTKTMGMLVRALSPEYVADRVSADHRNLPQSPTALFFPKSPTIDRREEQPEELRLRRTPARIGDPGALRLPMLLAESSSLGCADFPRRRMSHSTVLSANRDPYSRTFTRTETYKPEAINTGFGGFPNRSSTSPFRRTALTPRSAALVAAAGFARRRLTGVVPLEHSRTFQRSTTLASTKTGIPMNRNDQRTKAVSYITFDASVGRNSQFRGLTTAQQEELGGVEYRASPLISRRRDES